MTMINQLKQLIQRGESAGIERGYIRMNPDNYKALVQEVTGTDRAERNPTDFMGHPILLDSQIPPGNVYFGEISDV